MDIKKILMKVLKDNDDSDMVVEKSMPAKPEWKTAMKKLNEMGAKLLNDERKLKAFRDKFWADISIELNNYQSMRYNDRTEELELLKDVDDTKSIKSPFHGAKGIMD